MIGGIDMETMNDIYSYINNIKDILLLIDIKVEKENKLNNDKMFQFVNLLYKILKYIDDLENFLNKEFRGD